MMKIPPKKIENRTSSNLKELKDGFSYAFNFLPIRYILLLLAIVSLMGMPYQVLMPVFAKDIFNGGPHTLGYLMTAVGSGALIGALYLASRKSVLGLGRIIAIASGIFGLSLVFFALSKFYFLSLMILAFTGFGMMVQMASSNTVLQTIVDDDKRGRIMSFYAMAFMGTVPFGNLLAGSMSDLIGTTNTVLYGGICCILGAALFALKLPVIRKLIHPIYVSKDILPVEM
jgi:MFS family permease